MYTTQYTKMTTKEQAIELVLKFYHAHSNKMDDYSRIEYPTAKACALIVVDEIMRVKMIYNLFDYWKQVKVEIEKL